MLTTLLGRSAGFFRLAVLGVGAILVGCGGGGGGGGSSSPPPSKVFIAATITASPPAIGSVINPDPPAGVLNQVDRLIQAGSTGLAGTIGSLALDTQNDRLYAGNQGIVRVFNGASFADGGPSPARSFSFATGPAFNAASLFIDTVHNRLYLGDDGNSAVRVYDNASALNGAVDADRVITGFDTVLGVQVDTTLDILYVANRSLASVYTIRVYTGAGALSGTATPTHVITPHITSDMPVGDLFVDNAHDRLYVAGGTNTVVMVFETASGKDGSIAPDKTLTFPTVPISSLKTVVVASDRLFALGAGGVYLLNGVSSVSAGAVTGKAAVAPTDVTFTGLAVSP